MGPGSFHLAAACLMFGVSFSLPGTGEGAVVRRRFCALNWVRYPGNRFCFVPLFGTFSGIRSVSKSEKADLQVFITCAGCLRLCASGVVCLSTAAEKSLN